MDKRQSLVKVIHTEVIKADVFIAVVTPSYQEKVEVDSWPQKEFFLACSRSKQIMIVKEESVILSPTLEFGGASKVYTVWATGAGAAQLVEDMGLWHGINNIETSQTITANKVISNRVIASIFDQVYFFSNPFLDW